MRIRLLCVNGTPVKGETNTGDLLQAIIDAAINKAKETGDELTVEAVKLAEEKIAGGCNHCNWCLNSQSPEKICSKKDRMVEIYPKIIQADGIIYATPVYIGRLSWLLAVFIDRLRALFEGQYYGIRGPLGGVLKDKVIAAASVGWLRNGGLETAVQSVLLSGMIFDQVITTGGLGFGVCGVSAVCGQ